MFELLKEEDIEIRIGSVNAGGVSLLLYKNARVDQTMLDNTVGTMNWQKSYEVVGGNLFCTVSIYDSEKKMWIGKSDVGVESYSQAEKGEASDAFKRACFAWGIGRELYSAGEIFVPKESLKTYKNMGTKTVCYDKFFVERIRYDKNRKIEKISIINATTGKRVYVRCPEETEDKDGVKR